MCTYTNKRIATYTI